MHKVFTELLANRCCPRCLRPFVSGDDIVQVCRSVPSVRISINGEVTRFLGGVSVSYCDGHEPAVTR